MIEQYRKLIIRNPSLIQSAESTVRLLSSFLFSAESELEAELVHSTLNLNRVFCEKVQREIKGNNSSITRISTLIQVIDYVNVLIEMGAVRWSPKYRYHVVFILEIIKSLLYIRILYHKYFAVTPHYTRALETKLHKQVSEKNNLRFIAELLYFLRPVFYVGLLMKWGPRSWIPWSISLSFEMISHILHRSATGLTPIEQEELSARQMAFLQYVLRSPFFDRWFKPALESISEKLSNVPLVRTVLGQVLGYILSLQTYYFYTSGW